MVMIMKGANGFGRCFEWQKEKNIQVLKKRKEKYSTIGYL